MTFVVLVRHGQSEWNLQNRFTGWQDIDLAEAGISESHGAGKVLLAEGFKFDTGPSWYWMPDVFEQFFADFGKKPSDYYDLVKLNPSFSIFYKDDKLDIPSNVDEFPALFEKYELGAGVQFNKFMKSAKLKYEIGMNDFVQKPSKSIFEFIK